MSVTAVSWPDSWLGLALLAAFALVIGSFLGVLVIRLPEGRGVVFGRSSCAQCGQPLAARDLVPLLSWLWLRGRCRSCGATMGVFYPAIELAALGIALWAAAMTTGWLLLASCLFGWTLLTLAAIDARHYLLPDVLTLPLIPAGLAVAWFDEAEALPDHLLGALAGFAGFAVLAWAYRRWRGREGLGQGDAKLLAALGAWVAWPGLPSIVLLASLMALAWAVLRSLGGKPMSATDRLPFGPFLALGGWIVWLHGPLLLSQ